MTVFRWLAMAVVGLAGVSSSAQALNVALSGKWVGELAYRDYKEPVTSTARVQLPTWLTIEAMPDGTQKWRYTYDDGPGKVLEETDTIRFDVKAGTYSEQVNAKPATTYTVTGYDTLKAGVGNLVMMGQGTENGKPVDLRLAVNIRRNMLVILEETRETGSGQPFAFRHILTFIRAEPPAMAGAR